MLLIGALFCWISVMTLWGFNMMLFGDSQIIESDKASEAAAIASGLMPPGYPGAGQNHVEFEEKGALQ